MRKSITLLGGLFFLLFTFSSCLEEESVTTLGDESTENAIAEGSMSYRGASSIIAAGYDISVSGAETNGQENQLINIILSNREVKDANDRLTGTADMLIMTFMTEDGTIAGTYRPNEQSDDGFFYSNICTGMNFSTGAIIDDEGMEDGETIIVDNGDGSYSISFDFRTSSNNSVRGSWTGALVPAGT